MVTIKTHGKSAVKISETSIDKILGVYSDESISDRPTFVDAKNSGEISFTDLKAECNKILIPWQLFFLEEIKLDEIIGKIKEKRATKFDNRLIASRDNEGRGISLRIADRVIGLQEFAKKGIDTSNGFCGSLNKIDRGQWAEKITSHFEIKTKLLSSGNKEKTLNKLIDLIEAKNIRVARGVLTNKLLPEVNTIRSTYRKSSGFAVKDEKLPYIFLPSEINDNETHGRQILTLLVLLVLVGTDNYDTHITGDLELHIKNKRTLRQAFGVANEILLPFSETDKYRGIEITESIRDDLASRFMLTPSAVVVTLRQRDLIKSEEEQSALLDSIQPYKPDPKKQPRHPNIDTSVRKMCGTATTNDIAEAIKSKQLGGVEAQYLMFGHINKLGFVKFKANMGV